MRLSISAYAENRPAVMEAVRPFFNSDAFEDSGFVVFVGDCANVEDARTAATEAGALSCTVIMDEPAAESEKAAEAETAVEAPTDASTGAAPAEVASPEPEARVAPTLAFCARFSNTESGLAFARAAAGRVDFAEPPTGWDGDVWCVHGCAYDLDEVENMAQAAGGSTKVATETAKSSRKKK